MSMSRYLIQIGEHTDEELRTEANRLVNASCMRTAELIAHLAEIAERKAFLPEHTSLWKYCLEKLNLSEGQANTRLQVANVCREYPLLLDALYRNEISLTIAARLAPHLTEDNAKAVIRDCRGMTRRQVDEYLVRLKPKDPVSSGIRKTAVYDVAPTEEHSEPIPARRPTPVEPAQPDLFNFRFTASGAFKQKLDRWAEVAGVFDVGSHLAELIERAVDLALDKKDPKRKVERRQARDERARLRSSKARKEPMPAEEVSDTSTRSADARKTSGTGWVSVATREFVLARAGYQCELANADRRCSERSGLQVDHVFPRGMGGPDEVWNLRALCRVHNLWYAEQAYGREYVRAKMIDRQSRPDRKIPTMSQRPRRSEAT